MICPEIQNQICRPRRFLLGDDKLQPPRSTRCHVVLAPSRPSWLHVTLAAVGADVIPHLKLAKILSMVEFIISHPIVPLCVSHQLVTLVELLFTAVALKLKRVLVDSLVNSSHLLVKEILFACATLVRPLPCVADHVAPQGSL